MLKNRSMPQSVIIPEIPYPDVPAAVEWLCRSFGFSERLRIGSHRCQLTFGQGDVVVMHADRASLPQYSIMVRISHIEEHLSRAAQEGARIINPLADYPYGERQYTAEDLAGHRWTFSQTIMDIDPVAWSGVLMTGQE